MEDESSGRVDQSDSAQDVGLAAPDDDAKFAGSIVSGQRRTVWRGIADYFSTTPFQVWAFFIAAFSFIFFNFIAGGKVGEKILGENISTGDREQHNGDIQPLIHNAAPGAADEWGFGSVPSVWVTGIFVGSWLLTSIVQEVYAFKDQQHKSVIMAAMRCFGRWREEGSERQGSELRTTAYMFRKITAMVGVVSIPILQFILRGVFQNDYDEQLASVQVSECATSSPAVQNLCALARVAVNEERMLQGIFIGFSFLAALLLIATRNPRVNSRGRVTKLSGADEEAGASTCYSKLPARKEKSQDDSENGGLESDSSSSAPSVAATSASDGVLPTELSLSSDEERPVRIIYNHDSSAFFRMFSKEKIGHGQSGAKVVMCEMKCEEEFPECKLPSGEIISPQIRVDEKRKAIAKKFDKKADFEKEKAFFEGGTFRPEVGVITYYGWYEGKKRKKGVETEEYRGYVFTEYMNEGDGEKLREDMRDKSMKEKDEILTQYFDDLLAGLGAKHLEGKNHGDIKPENFLLTKRQTEVSREIYADLNEVSKRTQAAFGDPGCWERGDGDGKVKTGRGTTAYMSPQRLDVFRFHQCLGTLREQSAGCNFYLAQADDAFALGLTFLELLLGYNSFLYGVKDSTGYVVVEGIDFSVQYDGVPADKQRLAAYYHQCNEAYFQKIIDGLDGHFDWFREATSPLVKRIKQLVVVDEGARIDALKNEREYMAAFSPAEVGAASSVLERTQSIRRGLI